MDDKNGIVQDNVGLDEIISYDEQLDELEEALRLNDNHTIINILRSYQENHNPLPEDYINALVSYFDSRTNNKKKGAKPNKRYKIFRDLEIYHALKTMLECPKYGAEVVFNCDIERFNRKLPFNEHDPIIFPPREYINRAEITSKLTTEEIIKYLKKRTGMGRSIILKIKKEYEKYYEEEKKIEREILEEENSNF
jgi:hypothetical protein